MIFVGKLVKGVVQAPPFRGGLTLFNEQNIGTNSILNTRRVATVLTDSTNLPNRGETSSNLGLSYVLYENPSYPASLSPLVLQPGLFARKENFSKLGRQLHHLTSRSLIIPDVRNHGSSPSGASMSLKQMSSDSVRLIKELGVGKNVCLLGHATGGRVAMVTALTRPQLVDKLVVVSASPLNTQESVAKWENYKTAANVLKQLVKDDHILDFKELQDSRCLEFKLKVDDALKQILPNRSERALFLSSLGKVNIEAICENPSLGIFPSLESCTFNGSTLFISGSLAPAWRDDTEVRSIRQLFPNSHFVKIPGAGQWVQTEKEDEFLAVTSSFLQSDV